MGVLDHLFPLFHVRPARGYLNDPNGPVIIDGTLHLYFQYRPTLDLDSPVLWGHATSPDFVTWSLHRPAIAPDPVAGDRDGCWSGNTVIDDAGQVRAFYSGCVAGESLQRTLMAVSADGGRSFGPPRQVLPAPADVEGIQQMRDPFVWREDDGWQMVLGASGPEDIAMVRLYSSADLETWTYEGPLASLGRTPSVDWDSGQMWECPQTVRLDGRLSVLVGSWGAIEGVMDVLSFDAPEPGEELAARDLSLVDQGPNFYAASVLQSSQHGPLVWGWATEGRDPAWCVEQGWSGVLTLPRVLSRRGNGSLGSRPIPGMESLRVGAGRLAAPSVDGLPAQVEFVWPLDDVTEPARVRLRFSTQEFVDLTYSPAERELVIDRDRASLDTRADRGRIRLILEDSAPEPTRTIRGFLDGSILELFGPDGVVATLRCYPTTPPPWQVEWLSSTGAPPRVWALASAVPGPDAAMREDVDHERWSE